MTVHVLDTVPAEAWCERCGEESDDCQCGRRAVFAGDPPTEWKRPCDWCHGNRPPDKVAAPPCWKCNGVGTVTVPLRCQTCKGTTFVLGTVGYRTDVKMRCKDCHDGHPIIEHRIYGEDSMGYHFREVRLAIEAVPRDDGQYDIIGTEVPQ